jgi:hypothetical protein
MFQQGMKTEAVEVIIKHYVSLDLSTRRSLQARSKHGEGHCHGGLSSKGF